MSLCRWTDRGTRPSLPWVVDPKNWPNRLAAERGLAPCTRLTMRVSKTSQRALTSTAIQRKPDGQMEPTDGSAGSQRHDDDQALDAGLLEQANLHTSTAVHEVKDSLHLGWTLHAGRTTLWMIHQHTKSTEHFSSKTFKHTRQHASIPVYERLIQQNPFPSVAILAVQAPLSTVTKSRREEGLQAQEAKSCRSKGGRSFRNFRLDRRRGRRGVQVHHHDNVF